MHLFEPAEEAVGLSGGLHPTFKLFAPRKEKEFRHNSRAYIYIEYECEINVAFSETKDLLDSFQQRRSNIDVY